MNIAGVTVCQDDTCATTDVERAEVGQQLQIHCETECTVDVEWGQLNSDEPVNRNGRNLIVQNILDDSIGGRVYWCQCRGGDRECHLILGMQDVSTSLGEIVCMGQLTLLMFSFQFAVFIPPSVLRASYTGLVTCHWNIIGLVSSL